METEFEWKNYSIPLEVEDSPMARAFLEWVKEQKEEHKRLLEKQMWEDGRADKRV